VALDNQMNQRLFPVLDFKCYDVSKIWIEKREKTQNSRATPSGHFGSGEMTNPNQRSIY
jgi:hypothetical protein